MKRQRKKTLQDKKLDRIGRMPKDLIKALNKIVVKEYK